MYLSDEFAKQISYRYQLRVIFRTLLFILQQLLKRGLTTVGIIERNNVFPSLTIKRLFLLWLEL